MRRTGVRVVIPPAQLSSPAIWSKQARLLDSDELAGWRARNRPLLEPYGLDIGSVMALPLARRPRAGAPAPGPLQTAHRDRLILTGALGALAVSASGRGDLLAAPPDERSRLKKKVKENNDRNSTAAMTEALCALADAAPELRLHVAIGEGARLKPGEKGGNPTLFSGQTIGTGPKPYTLAVDTVEGTGKSTLFDHSSGTLLYVTEASIANVPDVYFDKCQLAGVDGVTVADPLERIVEAVRQARGTREVNLFALDRPRHPIDAMVAMGASMRVDSDGDAFPVIASGLAWGVFEDNLRPLDGVAGNIGGAAEMIASAAGGWYLGVRSTARFCAGTIPNWEARYDMTDAERADLTARGLDPDRVFRIEDLVPGIAGSDGAFVAAAISDNWHIPGLDAVLVGDNFAEVFALFVGAAGTADLYRIGFTTSRGWDGMVASLTPLLTRILSLPPTDVAAATRAALADPARARRLRHETETSFYTHIGDAGSGRLTLDLATAEKVEDPSALAFLRTVAEASGWFA